MPKPKMFRIGGILGVNRREDIAALKDGEAYSTQNLVPNEAGVLSTRLPSSVNAPVQVSGSGTPLAFKFIPFQAEYDYVVATRRTQPFRNADGTINTTFYDPQDTTKVFVCKATASGTSYLSVDTGHVTQYRPCIIFWDNRVWITFGHPGSYPLALVRNVPESGYGFEIALQRWESAPNIGSPVGGFVYRKRFFWFGLGQGFENYIVAADPGRPTYIGDDVTAVNGRSFLIGGTEGGRIVAGVDLFVNGVGAPAQSGALVLRDTSAHLIRGEPSSVDGSTIPNSMSIERLSIEAGCASAETVVRTPYGILWAGNDNVWFYDQGAAQPRRLGVKIRSVLQQTPASKKYLWHASYYNGFYRLAVASPGQSPSDDDAMGEEWWLDLRYGPPNDENDARWYGPIKYNTCMPYLNGGGTALLRQNTAGSRMKDVQSRNNDAPRLASCEGTQSYDDEGGTLGISNWIVDFDTPAGARDATQLDSGTYGIPISKVMGTEIQCELITKQMVLDDPNSTKLFHRAEINAPATKDIAFELDVISNGGVSKDTLRTEVPNSSFRASVDPMDTAAAPIAKEYAGSSFYPSDSQRVRSTRFQFALRNRPGYVVVTDENQFRIGLSDGSTLTCEIPVGVHLTLVNYLDRLVSGMNNAAAAAGKAITWSHNQTTPPPARTATVTISRATGALTWRWVNSDDVTRKIFGGLGFNVNALPSLSANQSATEEVYFVDGSPFDLGDLIVELSGDNRRPTK